MKYLQFFLIAFFTLSNVNAQTIWRVNNQPAADADAATLQGAHDTATAGDIIYLEPSSTNYGSCTFTKQLTVIGPGYFLDENDTTEFQTEAITDTLIFNDGSEGTVIMGTYINDVIDINADSITLKRNKIKAKGSSYSPVINNSSFGGN